MTHTTQLKVLVTGATGRLGGAVARVLLERGHRVRAFTRAPDSPEALVLKRLGAQVVRGGFEDLSSLKKAAKGVDAVFAMTIPFEEGTEAEVRQGINIAGAVRAAGVRHLVYSSVGSANRSTGIPHFAGKYKVEEYIRSLGIPFTTIGPSYFMENVLSPWSLSALQEGRLAIGLPSSRSLQMIALRDIAHFTALVFEYPERFLGQRIDIASDELTGVQAAGILSYVLGMTIEYQEIPISQQIPLSRVHLMSEDYALMLEWLDREGYRADIAALRRDHPEVGWHGYEQWARAQDWSILRAGKKAA